MAETGIYEKLITSLLQQRLNEENPETRYYVKKQNLDAGEAAVYLSRFLQSLLYQILESYPKGENKVSQQMEIANALIRWLQEYLREEEISENLIAAQGEILKAVYSRENSLSADLENYVARITPQAGLSQSELFTGANRGLSLESELKREILSSDEIWWIVSFIKWTGIRIFENELRWFTESGKKLKIVTTSYMGATDQKAVDFIGRLPNTEIKLSYNTSQERLHAKSYLFLRNTGFDTGYIGSSNISRSALTSGLEWNLKVTSQEVPHIIEKSKSTFSTYWASRDFEPYHPDDQEHRIRLSTALKRAGGELTSDIPPVFFDIEPHAYQKEILEKLQVERNLHHRRRNLLVAATGTGKTIISAFDYKRYRSENPGAKLLFTAHRKEILVQARQTFQAVLRDASFGELWVGDQTPDDYGHLFASVQMLNNNLSLLNLTSDFYEMIIIDEVHHIAANSYRPILNKFEPSILLGLTATPERHDGNDILPDFCGTIAAELRLPDAITRRYLCPFQYFGVDDPIDLSNVTWENGRYQTAELTRIYTANDIRVNHILRNMDTILDDIHAVKALAFCVSQDHAEFMHRKFFHRKIRTDVLISKNSDQREMMRDRLVRGDINILFVVDIFNEGVDIPEVDTVLFLRPTESLTVFLQQLGRGLRLAEGKDCLTVLDFVGNSRPEYDFSGKFRGMTGKSHISIDDEIEQGFPHLPPGCSIILQRKAKSVILNNIRSAIVTKGRLLGWLRDYNLHTSQPLSLPSFLNHHPSVLLEDIYRPKIDGAGGWTRLCHSAGLINSAFDEVAEKAVYGGIKNRLLQVTSFSYLGFLQKLFKTGGTWNDTDPWEQQWALMAHYDFWRDDGTKKGFQSLEESLNRLTTDPLLREECLDVIRLTLERIETEEYAMELPYVSALKLHSRYSRDAILAAFGLNSFEKKFVMQTGAVDVESLKTELLFVTLQKTEEKFSPTTLYKDYAIDENFFHWQSQNSARPDKGKGQSYVQQKNTGKTIILFVREKNHDDFGRTMGFVNLGPVSLYSHQGEKPMNIVWKLKSPLPPFLWAEAAKLSVG